MNDDHEVGATQELDAEAIKRLRQLDPGGQAGLLGRVLKTYALSLKRAERDLAQARAAHDLAAMQRLAHTLKSSSASVGALALSAQCAEIERRIGNQMTDGLAVLLDQMHAEIGRVDQAVNAMRSGS